MPRFRSRVARSTPARRRLVIAGLAALAAPVVARAQGAGAQPPAGAQPAPQAGAQAWPTRPIRLVVPYPPGGATDVAARLIAGEMSKDLGQQVVVENRPGAVGTIGTAQVAKSPPDGYTLVFGGPGNITLRAIMDRNLPYQPDKDLVPISHVANYDHLLIVRNDLPVDSVTDLVRHIKSNPGKLTYASSGNGGPQHLAMELLKHMAGLDLVHVPYKGEQPAVADLVAGRVDLSIISATAIGAFVRGNRVKLLAATNPYRSVAFPNAPTVHEAGVKGYEMESYGGILAPAGTPPAVVQRLNSVITAAMKRKDVQARFHDAMMFPIGSTPAEFSAFLKKEHDKWSSIIAASGAKLD